MCEPAPPCGWIDQYGPTFRVIVTVFICNYVMQFGAGIGFLLGCGVGWLMDGHIGGGIIGCVIGLPVGLRIGIGICRKYLGPDASIRYH